MQSREFSFFVNSPAYPIINGTSSNAKSKVQKRIAMNKSKHFALVAALLPIFAFAQNIQKEINEQVWKPFVQTFSNDDHAGFEAVHSKEIIRVLQDNGQIWGHAQYFPPRKETAPAARQNNKKNIELRFIQRIAGNDKAFEVGYYRTRVTNADGTVRDMYGKFHVVLRKENGLWKILVDADSNKGASKEDFEKAEAME
jgi:ketosteroid isomerase-like protein